MGVTAIPSLDSIPFGKIQKMSKNTKNIHYCPVNADFFQKTSGFLGHHRLSIIDLGADAHQPFLDRSSNTALVFNGEIYNYIELREELTNLGYEFQTRSDTEVVLNAYLEWGTNCFERFNGDFAILVYDHKKRVVIGARDRFGIKPLFFLEGNSSLIFSSELKGFLQLPEYQPYLDETVAYQYLVADFPTYDTLRKSFLKDIKSVPPAHWFKIRLDDMKMKFSEYWDIEEASLNAKKTVTMKDAIDQFDSLMENAVKIRLRSDVRLGLFLSGGIDSSSIAWHATKNIQSIPTFSSIFPGSDVDESEKINLLTEHLSVHNYQQQVDYNEFVREISDIVFLQDEPFSTLNVYSQYKNYQQASFHGVKAILDGGGADEYLAGYSDYRVLAAADKGDNSFLTKKEKKRLSQFITLSQRELADWYAVNENKKRTVDYINDDFRSTYRESRQNIDRPLDSNYKGLFEKSYLKNALRHSTVGSWMNKSIQWDNRYLDRTGMCLGIEGRVPFQDHRIIEAVFSLPVDYIYNSGYSKYILRKTMESRLPDTVVKSKQKIGYEFPFAELMSNNKNFCNYFFDLVEEKKFAEHSFVDKEKIIRELNDLKNGKSKNYNIWRVFNLHMWCNLYLG